MSDNVPSYGHTVPIDLGFIDHSYKMKYDWHARPLSQE
jgi:hypothetical protein